MDGIALALLAHRASALCEEMGVVLRRTALSPNIKDRLDYSCALFDAGGALFAQAAHIPVHLGSMAYALRDVVRQFPWAPGDAVVFNDPFLGGTHLPDVTVVVPAFLSGTLLGFAVTRAHHAHIGAAVPGSMPLSQHLEEEGLCLSPTYLLRGGVMPEATFAALGSLLRGPRPSLEAWRTAPGLEDFAAQLASAQTGATALAALAEKEGGAAALAAGVEALHDYGERLARQALAALPEGRFEAEDALDDDGFSSAPIPLRVAITLEEGRATVDCTGSAPTVAGNLNCPAAVTAAGVFYAFRCLMPPQTPASAGAFRPIELVLPTPSLLAAEAPAAVAAGNVETSMRVVDVVLRALAQALPERVPAASQGTMNNLALGAGGDNPWDYYETLAGGHGASARGPGASAQHSHMTNTLNTPIESVELHYPLRVLAYGLRSGSGGAGRHAGGEGVLRRYAFLAPATLTLLSERRSLAPWGLAGGEAGQPGRNVLNGVALPGKVSCEVAPGDVLTIETPGGGGYGEGASEPRP